MVTQIAIVILSAVGMFVIWYFFLRKGSKDVPEPTNDVPVSYLTPKGATVYSKGRSSRVRIISDRRRVAGDY
jgi:flagellar basal body-associated protein FliL